MSFQNIDKDSVKHILSVQLEIRPRIEFKDDYKLSVDDKFEPNAYMSVRNRLNINYLNKNLNTKISFQEIHLIGKNGKFSEVGSINMNELYIEPKLGKKMSLLVGRQNFQLDNGRIFSAAPWSQQHRSHEGLRLQYIQTNLRSDFALFFTRKYSNQFDAAYSPVASHKYKYLLVHHLKETKQRLTYTLINSAEVFDETYFNAKRYISGGRLEYQSKKLYLTTNAFYQYGRNQQNQKVSAYYIQPEISTNLNKFNVRLGTEILSGSKNTLDKGYSNSYEITYGVAWKFMGNMNFYAKFPSDVGGRGLINPYLFLIHRTSKKIQFRFDSHLFYNQYSLLLNTKPAKKYLGSEFDFSINYNPLKNVELNYGFSYYLLSSTTPLLNKVQNSTSNPIWSYLMISYRPNILRLEK